MQRRVHALSFSLAFFAGFAVSVGACAVTQLPAEGGSSGGDGPGAGGATVDAAACPLCVTDNDCNGGVCAQVGSDSYCAPTCPNGNECSSDRTCEPVTTVSGEQKSACVPSGGACGAPVGPSASDAGGCSAPSDTCGSLVGPSVAAQCKCASGKQCAANGCYGGWFCNTTTNKCQAPPASSTCPCSGGGGGGADGGSGPVPIAVDGGAPVSGTVGADGGSVSRLLFTVVGDTRPPTINDTAGYPTQVITKIWQDIEAMNPHPPFAVSTGDYVFSTGNGTEAAPQMDLYLNARKGYTGIAFPTMGNHECTGAVTSNCGPGNTDGLTNNYQTFMSKMLAPLGKTSPNYAIDINASDNSWTAKFVFVAGNAWSTSDATWLDGVLSKPTTYTFIVRHEPRAATSPGESGSEPIMAKYPYTLAIVGHTHTYGKTGTKQVTIGNGGAPLTGGANYGFGLIQQLDNGNVQVDMINYETGQADGAFRFVLKPDGSPG